MITGYRPLRHYLIPLRFEYLRVALKYSVYEGLGDVGALVFVTYSYIAGRIRLKSMKAHRNAFSACISEWGGPHRVRTIPVLGGIFHQFEQVQIRVVMVP